MNYIIGKKWSDISEDYKHKRVRIFHEGQDSIITADVDECRLNVTLDENGIVKDVYYG